VEALLLKSVSSIHCLVQVKATVAPPIITTMLLGDQIKLTN